MTLSIQDPSAPPATGLALRVAGVAKRFGTTQALRDAQLEVRAGEIHAVMGENGSGKSTLVKILSGIHRPDAGSIEIGERAGAPRSPADAAPRGIATVFQEAPVVGPRSVLENVWLGTDGVVKARVAVEEKRRRAGAALAELLEAPPDLDAPVETLSLSDRQACCVARALVRDPRVLILDEATSSLDVATRDRLFEVLRRRTRDGVSVVFISHRMDEIAAIADACTVMRSGTTVATLDRDEMAPDELVRLMSGDERAARRAARAVVEPGPVVLDVHDPEVAIRAGELVGLGGLEGHGQDAFLQALWGLARTRGVRAAYVPRERRTEGLFATKSIRENFGVTTLRDDVRGGLLQPGRTRMRLAEYVDKLRITLGRPDDAIETLSGGNQQKVLMARWLATSPDLLLLNDPTRGIDPGAKHDLYALLSDLAAGGMAIVVLSTELDELVELMDRVLVFREHALAAELPRRALSRQALVAAFFGSEVPDA